MNFSESRHIVQHSKRNFMQIKKMYTFMTFRSTGKKILVNLVHLLKKNYLVPFSKVASCKLASILKI